MKLHDSFGVRLTANCPHAQVRGDALRHVDEAMRREVGCSFVFGGRLTKSGRATLVHGYCGQLFAFLLTPEQASAYGAGDDALIAAFRATHQSHGRSTIRPSRSNASNSTTAARSTMHYAFAERRN